MKKRALYLLCAVLTVAITGCGGSKETSENTASKDTSVAAETEDVTTEDVATEVAETEDATAEDVTALKSDKELFEAFLKDNEEVHFNNFRPECYFEINEYMFDEDESCTLSELLERYDRYYLEELSYSDIYKNIKYTYIDAGAVGNEQLVVECSFPQGGSAQYVIEAKDGQLEMLYTIDGFDRVYGTVANGYGLISRSGSSSYAEYSTQYEYLNEKGEISSIYSESDNYAFGEETGYADPLLEWAADFKAKEGFKEEAVLKTYSFDVFESDFTPEGEEAYYNDMMYTVEYMTDGGEFHHEDEMYEKGSIFDRIFEKAGRRLSTPEEIEKAIEKKKTELNMPKEAMNEEYITLTEMTQKEVGAVVGADVDDGRSELSHALTAYAKFLKNPVNMCEILTEKTNSPYGNPEPGLVYGFALRDFTEDGIPELVIDFGQAAFPLMQKIYIYRFDESTGMVSRMFKMPDGANGDYGLKYLREEMNESYVQIYNEEYEKRVAQCPDYADSLLNVKYEGPHMVGTYGKYLVTFDGGVEEDMSETLTWYDFVNDDAQSYTEILAYMEGDEEYLDYTTDESCIDEPEEILDNFKPILFYDITDENIEKIVNEDYWKANSGEDAFSDYTVEDAYNYLTQKSIWYYDLGIMDDDDTYDTCNCYDYDEETEDSITIYFDLDQRIQSRFDRFT